MSLHPIQATIYIEETMNDQGGLALSVKFNLHGTALTADNIASSPALQLIVNLNEYLQNHRNAIRSQSKGYHKC